MFVCSTTENAFINGFSGAVPLYWIYCADSNECVTHSKLLERKYASPFNRVAHEFSSLYGQETSNFPVRISLFLLAEQYVSLEPLITLEICLQILLDVTEKTQGPNLCEAFTYL